MNDLSNALLGVALALTLVLWLLARAEAQRQARRADALEKERNGLYATVQVLVRDWQGSEESAALIAAHMALQTFRKDEE